MSDTLTISDLENADNHTSIVHDPVGPHPDLVCDHCEDVICTIDPADQPDLLAMAGIAAEHLDDCDSYQDSICRDCGEPNDDGEGFDGYCGNCADRAEQRGEYDHWDA